jgi:hypothetical protein
MKRWNFVFLGSSVVIVFGLMFVGYYLNSLSAYLPNRQKGLRSGTGFHHLERFTEQFRTRSLLAFVPYFVVLGFYAVATYTTSASFGGVSYFVMFSLVLALAMAFHAVIGLMILRTHVVVESARPLTMILLMGALLGALCNKSLTLIYKLFMTSSTSDIFVLVEGFVWMVQSPLQTLLIVYALRREGRFARVYCGISPLSLLLISLGFINLGDAAFQASVQSFIVRSIVSSVASPVYLNVWIWIYSLTFPLVMLFNVLSFQFLIFILVKYQRVFSEIKRRNAVQHT